MFEIKRVKKLESISPNIIAVVNAPENYIPARGYIISKRNGDIKKIYGGIEQAAEHFAKRATVITKGESEPIIYILGFIYGEANKNPPVPDIFFYPFSYSENKRARTIPFITKDGTQQPWPMREGGDHHLILADEERQRRRIFAEFGIERHEEAIKKHMENFPPLTGLKYLDQNSFMSRITDYVSTRANLIFNKL